VRVHRGHPCDASPEEDAADADALFGLDERDAGVTWARRGDKVNSLIVP
jgi:hypothetical protein